MTIAVQEILELPTVKGLQDLRKAYLLEVTKSLYLADVKASYTKA